MTEIVKAQPTVIEALKETVLSTALDTFTDLHPHFVDVPLPVLFAEARIATDIARKERNPRERQVVHFVSTLTAVGNAVVSGFIETPEEATTLTDALLYANINPSAAIRFLNPDKVSRKLTRALTPRELAAAVILRDDFSYEDDTVSIPTLANAAREIGINLEDAQVDDDALSLLAAAIEHYDGISRFGRVEDDPIDGPVMTRRGYQFTGSTALRSDPSLVNHLQPEDVNVDPLTRIFNYAEEALIPVEDLFSAQD